MKTAYPIVLTSTEEGYTAYIPDFNITAKGEQQSDAINAAKNAICMWAFSEENAEKPIPKPFSTNGIAAKSGQIVTLIDVSFKKLRQEFPRIHVGDELPFYCMNLIFYCKHVIISI